jgi:nucleoside-diphosphate-sugar epimerase
MKIAIAGAGAVGMYFVEEFSKSDHDVLVLARSIKKLTPGVKVDQQVSDYSVQDLLNKIEGCDALLSTVSADEDTYIAIHASLLEACRRSKSCKRFIPSEWTVNVQDFPDQPEYIVKSRETTRSLLRAQKEVEWTIVCNGWFIDFLLPRSRRYLADIGRAWVADPENKIFDMYGDGLQEISLTSVRDVARAAIKFVEQPRGSWPEYIHFAAQTMTYRDLFQLLKRRDPSWSVRPVTLTEVLHSVNGQGPKLASEDLLTLMGFTRVNRIRVESALTMGTGVFKGFHARTVEQVLQEADRSSEGVL